MHNLRETNGHVGQKAKHERRQAGDGSSGGDQVALDLLDTDVVFGVVCADGVLFAAIADTGAAGL